MRLFEADVVTDSSKALALSLSLFEIVIHSSWLTKQVWRELKETKLKETGGQKLDRQNSRVDETWTTIFWPKKSLIVLDSQQRGPIICGPHGLTFTWWGCCGLCFQQKPTEFAHSFLFCSCVCFRLYGPFICISFHKFPQLLSAFSLCSSGLISALLVLSTTYLLGKFPSALIKSFVVDWA